MLFTFICKLYSYGNQYHLFSRDLHIVHMRNVHSKSNYFMVRISVLRLGTNTILCEVRGFVYIQFEVRVSGY
jgi:hypothetical protein